MSPTRGSAPRARQSSCLSPVLYNKYTDDIPCLTRPEVPYPGGVALALFADDSAYFATSTNAEYARLKLQRTLDVLQEWLDKWRIAVNISKTATIVLSHRRPRLRSVKLRRQDVGWRSTVKYLRVHMDRQLTMGRQVEEAINASKAARAMLRPVLVSNMPLRVKFRVYKTDIRLQLTYAIQSWWPLYSASNHKRVEAQQAIALRACTGAGRYVRNEVLIRDLRVPQISEFAATFARRMFSQADNGPHNHLHGIAPLHAQPPDN